MSRKLHQQINLTEVAQMLKDADIIKHINEMGMGKGETLSYGSYIVAFKENGWYNRSEVARFISDYRMNKNGNV